MPAESRRCPTPSTRSLFARLRSGKNTLPVVEAAALIGSRFDRALLSSVVDLDKPEIDELLDELDARPGVRSRSTKTVGVSTTNSCARSRRRSHRPPSAADYTAESPTRSSAHRPMRTPNGRLVARHYERAERFDEAAKRHQEASTGCAAARCTQRSARPTSTAHWRTSGASPPVRRATGSEIAARLEAGFLASAAQGHASAEAAAEFERCLQLIGPDPTPELYATLNALWIYYTARGDLRRATQLAETLKAKLGHCPSSSRAPPPRWECWPASGETSDAARDDVGTGRGAVSEDGSRERRRPTTGPTTRSGEPTPSSRSSGSSREIFAGPRRP